MTAKPNKRSKEAASAPDLGADAALPKAEVNPMDGESWHLAYGANGKKLWRSFDGERVKEYEEEQNALR